MPTTLENTEVGPRPNSADERCAGCDQPGHEVGHLTPCVVTYHTGVATCANYCAGCLNEYEAAPGFVHQNTDIARIERVAGGAS